MNLEEELEDLVLELKTNTKITEYGYLRALGPAFVINPVYRRFTEFQQDLIGYFFLYCNYNNIISTEFLNQNSTYQLKTFLIDTYFNLENKYKVIHNES